MPRWPAKPIKTLELHYLSSDPVFNNIYYVHKINIIPVFTKRLPLLLLLLLKKLEDRTLIW